MSESCEYANVILNFCYIYFKISGVLKGVIDYDFTCLTLVCVYCCCLRVNNICKVMMFKVVAIKLEAHNSLEYHYMLKH